MISKIKQMVKESFNEITKRFSPRHWPLFYIIFFMAAGGFTLGESLTHPENLHVFFNKHTLSNWGLSIDIVGFLLLRAEWKLAAIAPASLAEREIRYIEKEIAVLLEKKAGMTEEEADRRKVGTAPHMATYTEYSINEQIARRREEILNIRAMDPERFAHKRRMFRFELGAALIVIGFVLQFVGNLYSYTALQ